MATGSSYPASLDAFTNRANGYTVTPTDWNLVQDAAENIEAELGTAPKGTYADVKTRLDDAVYQGAALTNRGAVYATSGTEVKSTAALTNGQVLIGSTGADPVAATLTQGTNVTITNGAGTITIAASGTGGGKILDVVTKTTVFTTISTSFVAVTDLTITATTTANRVLLSVNLPFEHDTLNNNVWFSFGVDGTVQGDATGGLFKSSGDNAGSSQMGQLSFVTAALTAASHTFTVQMRVAAGTGSLRADDVDVNFSAIELTA